jgi:hypothetical protein
MIRAVLDLEILVSWPPPPSPVTAMPAAVAASSTARPTARPRQAPTMSNGTSMPGSSGCRRR